MNKFLATGNNFAAWGVAALSGAVLGATIIGALQHKLGSLDSVITAQIALAALAFVPPVLSELRDRQTLSVYRAMRLRK
ncbi:MAG: hypothetical protein RL328_290 [Acidobacteriota bacterium]